MSEENKNLYQRLIAVRSGVNYLQKANDNRQQGFSYVSSSQVLASVREGMNREGIMVIPTIDVSEVRDHATKSGGHQYMTIITIRYIIVNADNPDEKIEIVWTGHGLDQGEKGPGKALTYAEKYLFLKLFNIPTDSDDPDSFGPQEQGLQGPPPVAQKQIDEIKALYEGIYQDNSDGLFDYLGGLGFGLPQGWTADTADRVIAGMRKKLQQITDETEGGENA